MDLLKDVLGIGDNVLDFAKNSLNTMKLSGKRFFDNAANYLQNTAPARAAQNALQQTELARINLQREQEQNLPAERVSNMPQFLHEQIDQSAPGRFATGFVQKTGIPDYLTSVAAGITAPLTANRFGAEAERLANDYYIKVQEATAAQQRGDFETYKRLMAEAEQLRGGSMGLQRSFETYTDQQAKKALTSTVNTELAVASMANPAKAVVGAGTGALIGGGINAVTGGDIATGLGEGAGQGLKYATVNKLTAPVIDPIVEAFGKGQPIVAKLVSRALAHGGLNVGEDEIFTRLMEGRAPTGTERAISFGAGAVTSPLVKYDPDNSFLEIVDGKLALNQKWIRDSLGRFAEQVGLTPDVAKQKLEEALEVARQDAIRQANVPVNSLDENGAKVSTPMFQLEQQKRGLPVTPTYTPELNDGFFKPDTTVPKTTLDASGNPMKTGPLTEVAPGKWRVIQDRIKNTPPTQAAGVMAGVETYQDEEGKTKVRFDPAKAAAGLAITAGFTSTKKHLSDFEDVITKTTDPEEAGKVITDMADIKINDLIEKIKLGDKEAINDLRGIRAAINKIMYKVADVDPKAGKYQKVVFETMKQDPMLSPFFDLLDNKLADIDKVLADVGINPAGNPKVLSEIDNNGVITKTVRNRDGSIEKIVERAKPPKSDSLLPQAPVTPGINSTINDAKSADKLLAEFSQATDNRDVAKAKQLLEEMKQNPETQRYVEMSQKFIDEMEVKPEVADATTVEQNWTRFADDANRETYQGRGGTWFTNDKGSDVIKDAMDPKNGQVSIGGSKQFNETIQPKNPLIIEDAMLEDGSFSVINSGYENFIDRKYARIAEQMWNDVRVDNIDDNQVDGAIRNALKQAGIPKAQIMDVFTKFKANKFDAAMDLIISKALKEQGYDALVLKSGDAQHLFNLNQIDVNQPAPKVDIQPDDVNKEIQIPPSKISEIPPVLYHGTNQVSANKINENGLKASEDGIFGRAVYLTNSKQVADGYGFNKSSKDSGGKAVIETKVDIKNPYIMDGDEFLMMKNTQLKNPEDYQAFINTIKQDHDAIVIKNAQADGEDYYAIFDENKVSVNQPGQLNDQFFKQPETTALPQPEAPKLLGPGTKEVATGRQARQALKNPIPGQDIEVNNPLRPGTKPIIPGNNEPIVVRSASQARRIRQQYPDANIKIEPAPLRPGTKPLETPVTNAPQLGAGFFKVKSGKEARKAMIPGATVEVDNPLPAGKDVIPLAPEDSAIPRTTIGDVEKQLYGSETAKAEDLGGTKEGAGRISDFLRTLQAKASDTVAKGLESDNAIVRNAAKLAQGFAGGLGKTQDQIENKIRYKGSIDYATKLATDVQQKIKEFTGGDLGSYERIHAVMDPELATEKISYDDLTPEEQQATDFLRVVSDFINDTNYKNGFISKEKWLANKGGKYIARAYEDYDFPPEVADFMKQRNAKFDLNPFKQRGDVTDWKQENAIRDPAYLTAKRLQQTLFNDEVRRYTDWLKTEKNLVSDVERPGYVQLSDHKAYGDLAGKWVRKDALEDIRGFFFTNDVAQKAYDVLNWWDRNPLRKGRKKLLTVYNPAVRLGNNTGNYVFAWLNGINPVTFTKNRVWAEQAIKNNDPLYRKMMQDGLLGSDVTKADITRLATELREGITDKNMLKQIDEVITDSYGRVDDIAKLSAMKTWLDRGYSYKEASRRVLSGFQSYSMVGFLYDLGAKVPVFGNPFVRFASEMTRITKNAVVDHPVRAIATVAAWKLFTDIMSKVSGETPEDRKTREGRIGAPRIPFTNISLAVQTPWGEVNAARLIGLYSMNSTESNLNSDVSKMMPFQTPSARNLGSDPVIGPLVSLAIDKDFRGKSISDPDQNKYTGSLLTDEEKNINRLKYAVRSYNLPSLNDISDLIAASKGEENFYGQKRSVKQAAARLFGLKVEQFGATEAQSARDREAQYQQSHIEAEQKKISAIKNQLKKGEITQEQAEKRINSINAGIQKAKAENKPTTTGSVKLSPYLKEMYGIDKIEAMPNASEYDQLKREKEAYKAIDTILDDEVLDDSQKQAAMDGLGLKKTDVDYYRQAKETADLKAVYIQEQGLEHDELIQYLIGGRRKVNGKMMADNTVIDYLYDEQLITKDEAKKLKKIEYDRDGNLILPQSGSGSSTEQKKFTKEFFNNQIQALDTLPKFTGSRVPTSASSPQMPSGKLDQSTAELTPRKVEAPALDGQFFQAPTAKKTGVSAEAYNVVNRSRGGGSVSPGSTPRKLSQSFFSRRRS